MLTEKQIKIFEAFIRNPFNEITRQEVKVLSNEKSNNTLSLAMSQFKKENLIIERKVGKSSLYKLNFENDIMFYYMALVNQKKIKKNVALSLDYIKKDIQKITPFFSITIFGSYAIQKEKKDSDLDIAIFIEDEKKIGDIKRNLKNSELKSILKLDIYVISKEEIKSMILNETENLGKQIFRKHLAVYNHKLFYDLLNEGIKNGFRI